MNIKDKKVLVVGLAVSGISAVKLLKKLGAIVTVYDSKSKEQLSEILKTLDEENVSICLGNFKESLLDSTDLIVVSPGVPTDLLFLQKAKNMLIPIWSEVELAYRQFKGKLIGITGTNGKTTTTTLVGQIMKAYYKDVYVVGNIGLPFSEIVLKTTENSIAVAEISSFQLETIDTFKPDISCILNFAEDHLNRHKTFDNYIAAKKRITENQTTLDICVLNNCDLNTKEISKEIKAIPYFFSSKEALLDGVFMESDCIYISKQDKRELLCKINELKVLGIHNYENVMAAVAISVHMNIPINIIKKVITSFYGVEHRIEYVTSINNVAYYNDSKATNPDAAIKGVTSMQRPTILIAGGMDKGNDFSEWIKSFGNRVKQLIVFGETKQKIADTALLLGFKNVLIVDSLQDAVEKASEISQDGDCILLSPACASWDMFKNFEERGNLFKHYVAKLKE